MTIVSAEFCSRDAAELCNIYACTTQCPRYLLRVQVASYKKFISFQKAHNVAWDRVWECDQKAAYRYYEAHLKACNAVDFDGLLSIVDTTLATRPSVLAAQRRRYEHLLCDEFQVCHSLLCHP